MKHLSKQQTERSRRGAVTVEFAMVFPIILLMFFGSIEMASLFFAKHTMGYAAYEAARRTAIPGSSAATGQAAGMHQLNLVGLGSKAQITVTKTATTVTSEVRIPSSGFSWSPVGWFANFTLVERCTLTRE